MEVAEVYGGCIWQWRKYMVGVDGGDLRMVRVGSGGVTNMTITRNSIGTRR
jgi:hypothetical protein